MSKTLYGSRTNNTQTYTCADCALPIRRNMRFCLSCGRPIPGRISVVSSVWSLLSFWVVVIVTVYGLVAVLRFVAPVTLRVTCVKQIVPSRLLLVPTATYTELLSTGDCSVPKGSLVVLSNVPPWLVAAAARDEKNTVGWLYVKAQQYGAPIGTFVTRYEAAVTNQAKLSWHSAWVDVCRPAWVAPWCKTK